MIEARDDLGQPSMVLPFKTGLMEPLPGQRLAVYS